MKKSVRETLISLLQSGSTPTASLVSRASLLTTTTPQAIYKSLTTLKKEGVVVASKRITSLSLLFIEKEKERWDFTRFLYTHEKTIAHTLKNDGTKVTYSFHTVRELDLFWTHVYTILAEQVDQLAVRYMLIPHDFFSYALAETDSFWVKKNINPAEKSRLVVPYALPLDKEVVRMRKHNLKILLGTKGRFSLTIERNTKKAEKMEKRLEKYFE